MTRRPLLSVVAIAYDTETLLPACLDSMLRQDVPDVQIVVVDDGSTDRTGEVADQYAARHPSIEVVHRANGGVSAARQTGLEHCTGQYLAFADSDDRVAEDAWSTMLRTAETTGSAMVVGAAERVHGDRTYRTPLMARNHAERRLGATVEDQPLMLGDVFAWNKLFRRSFWDEAGLEFELGTSYQDQPALTRAYLTGAPFDVLTETVYHWHVRDDLSSATQQRSTLRNLRQRMATKQQTVDLVRAHGPGELLHVLFADVLPVDMWEHFRAARVGGDTYWTELRAGLLSLWGDHSVPFEQTSVPPRQRLMGQLVAEDRRTDLAWLVDRVHEGVRGAALVTMLEELETTEQPPAS